MRAIAGQVAGSTGRLLHRLLHVVLAIIVVLGVAALALSWRLARGPLELPWLAHRLEAAANADGGPTRLSIGRLTLAWNGFSSGDDHPLEIELFDVAAIDAQGATVADLRRGAVTLSPGQLLIGRVRPRSITVDGARLRALRAADGGVKLDLGSLDETAEAAQTDLPPVADPQDSPAAMLNELAKPAQTDAGSNLSRLSQLRSLRIRGAAVTVVDRQLGLTWDFPRIAIDLERRRQGGIDGTADLSGSFGDQPVHLAAQAKTAPNGRDTLVQLQLDEVAPTRLAEATPALRGLGKIGLPVTLSASAALGPDLVPTRLQAQAKFGQGAIAIGAGRLPITSAVLHADGTLDAMDLTLERIELAPASGKPVTVLTGKAEARRTAGLVKLAVTLDLDAVAFADLPDLWPIGIGGKGTRPWISQNITDGVASDLHVEMALQLPNDFSSADLTELRGGFDGHDLTVHWLAPVPPLEHGEARVSFEGPDVIEIAVRTARQAGAVQSGVMVRNGMVRFTGLSAKDQFADIDADLAGPLADVLTVLKHPRLQLLEKHPVELRNPAGQLTGHLGLAHVPLEDKVSLDDIHITAVAHMTDVHLGGTAAGRDLDRGVLDIAVSNDGLKLTGRADVAKIPAQLQVEMDFRSGPPSQVLQKVLASASIDAKQLQSLGLDVGEMAGGAATMQAEVQTRRDGRGDITVHADLTRARLQPPRLNWSKPADHPATAEMHLLLDHDRLAGIDRLRVQGDGIDIDGRVDFAAGKPSGLRLQRVALGRAIDAHGEIRWPASPGAPWVVNLAGPLLDVSARNGPKTAKKPATAADDAPGTPYQVDAQFGRILFGPNRALTGVALRADNDGRIFRSARLSGHSLPGNGGAFELAIVPTGRDRSLTGSAADLGALLRAVDVFDDIRGGRLTVSGGFNDGSPRHLLSGTAALGGFNLLHAPVVAKILQAMTLYGLVEAMQGPGLVFDRLVAPFQYANGVVALGDARAYSASLGMTVKGRLDSNSGGCDLEGTIVPAYFFNTLLGNIPLVGRLFSPEKGGGLFAATYSVRGPCDDPGISVNPLAAVTPGFLRGVFDIFDEPRAGTPQRAPAPLSQENNGGKN